MRAAEKRGMQRIGHADVVHKTAATAQQGVVFDTPHPVTDSCRSHLPRLVAVSDWSPTMN
jgi:hypothetical protein